MSANDYTAMWFRKQCGVFSDLFCSGLLRRQRALLR